MKIFYLEYNFRQFKTKLKIFYCLLIDYFIQTDKIKFEITKQFNLDDYEKYKCAFI